MDLQELKHVYYDSCDSVDLANLEEGCHHVVCAPSATWGFAICHYGLQLLIRLHKGMLEQTQQPMAIEKAHEALPFATSSKLLQREQHESTCRFVIGTTIANLFNFK